jgi:ADP-ribose pyrophosphatase YjhB (NUDIX family)
MCLSVFLLLGEPGQKDRVVLGHLNPKAPWDRIGALDAARAAQHQKGWTIPSCHLLYYESPADAAQRIAREQLDLSTVDFEGPQVISEAYTRPSGSPNERHWDLGFVFRGTWPAGRPMQADPWTELRYVDVAHTPRSAFARSHADVLDLVGLPAAP